MSTSISNCAVAPPPLVGGGAPAQSPVQAPLSGGGAMGAPVASPMQVPMAPSGVQAATGGGQLVQPAPVPTQPAPVTATPVATQPAPVATTQPAATDPAAGAQPAAPTSTAGATGGGPVDMNQLVPVIQQLVTTLTALTTALQQQGGMPGAQAQAGAAGVQGGGGTAPEAGAQSATADAGASVEGGGASSPVQQAPSGGGCGCSHAAAAGEQVGQTPPSEDKKPPKKEEKPPKHDGNGQQLPPAPPLPGTGGSGKIDGDGLTVKGKAMSAEQKRLTEIVLKKGQQMGANQKVLETAVATMIQESVIKNDSSVDSKDHDSLGLFQQRPSAGWGTREQISNPEYAAQKFFEKAIANDKKNPGQAKTRLAQSVQISAFPDAYAQWDKEAEKIVADFLN